MDRQRSVDNVGQALCSSIYNTRMCSPIGDDNLDRRPSVQQSSYTPTVHHQARHPLASCSCSAAKILRSRLHGQTSRQQLGPHTSATSKLYSRWRVHGKLAASSQPFDAMTDIGTRQYCDQSPSAAASSTAIYDTLHHRWFLCGTTIGYTLAGYVTRLGVYAIQIPYSQIPCATLGRQKDAQCNLRT